MGISGRSRQAVTSDKSKQARKSSKKYWGGRRKDGSHDGPQNLFLYKIAGSKTGRGRRARYKYNNWVRRRWNSYRRRY